MFSAYELFADFKAKAEISQKMAVRFKETFSRPKVKVHFLGAWCTSISFVLVNVHESIIL
jgi:uncharacterized protein (DUF2235 family)